jgi:hypothetical protein
MTRPTEIAHDLAEDVEKRHAILVVGIDVLLPVTAGRDVVEGSGKLDAKRACHGRNLPKSMLRS